MRGSKLTKAALFQLRIEDEELGRLFVISNSVNVPLNKAQRDELNEGLPPS